MKIENFCTKNVQPFLRPGASPVLELQWKYLKFMIHRYEKIPLQFVQRFSFQSIHLIKKKKYYLIVNILDSSWPGDNYFLCNFCKSHDMLKDHQDVRIFVNNEKQYHTIRGQSENITTMSNLYSNNTGRPLQSPLSCSIKSDSIWYIPRFHHTP